MKVPPHTTSDKEVKEKINTTDSIVEMNKFTTK
jgi:hypothetical protein